MKLFIGVLPLILASVAFAKLEPLEIRSRVPVGVSVPRRVEADISNELVQWGQSQLRTFPASFKVLVWNMHKSLDANWSHDFNQFMNENDLLVLQEAFLDPINKEYYKNDPFHWNMAISFFENDIPTGVLTGSTADLHYAKAVRSFWKEPIIKTSKMILATKHYIGTQELMVINIHSLNFRLADKFYLDQLDKIRELLAAYTGAVILAGDFNTWSPRRKRLLLELAHHFDLLEVPFHRPTNRLILDHVFTKGLTITESKVLWDINSSDHKPLQLIATLP